MNYNAGRALRRCVASLLDEGVAEVRVVDNASTDGSIEILEAAFPGHPSLRVTRNTTNVGYSKAVNAAADRVGEGRLLVINPDAHLCPGALTRLETALDQAPGVALAAPLVRDAGGTPEPAAFRPFPDAWRSFVHFTGLSRLAGDGGALEGVRLSPDAWPTDNAPAEAVSGACFLVDAATFAGLGGFDTHYPFHCEDLDLMYRLKAAGHGRVFVPGAEAVHDQGISSASRPLWVHRQKHRGMQRFYRKFQAGRHAAPVRWLVQAGIWGHWAVTAPWVWLKS